MYDFGGPLVIDEIELKPPADDEVIVKMAATGICRTDLSVLDMKLPYPPPVVLGHEGAGVVEWVGPAVRHLSVGDHVVMAIPHRCGVCHWCVHGQPHLCERTVASVEELEDLAFTKDGMDIGRFGGIGALAERSAVRAHQCVKIDDDVPLNRACLVGCAVLSGLGAVLNKAKVSPGQTVAVFGCGGIGLNAVQGAKIAGARTVIAIDIQADRLADALKFGATHTINPNDVADIASAVADLTNGVGVDFAFECVGSTAAINDAFVSARRGGAAVVVGVAPFGVDVSLTACVFSLQERSLLGCLYGSPVLDRDVPMLLAMYGNGQLNLDDLVTREIGLADVNEAIEALRRGDGIRTVVIHDGFEAGATSAG